MPQPPATPQPDGAGADSTSSEAMRAVLERKLAGAPAHGARSVPPSVPDHVLLRHVGSGAYGDVWLARSALGTLRAVKVIYRARFQEDRPYEREFHGILKYEPVSRSHEGLVQVLHVGRNDEAGYFYYVMELADPVPSSEFRDAVPSSEFRVPSSNAATSGELGTRNPKPETRNPKPETRNPEPETYLPRTLRSDLARRPRLPPVEAAQLVLRLAEALEYLHAQGLVHRDIKPSNVIFVDGQPKLADIGLVTDVGSSHSFVGTEGFIPPEGPGTSQADLYGLGKLLYELATGRDRMDFPQLPAGVTRLPEGEALLELNEVITRACAPEPQRRYRSATEMQAEINLFLAGRSLRQARNIELHLVRLKRFALVAGALVALAAGIVWYTKLEERRARKQTVVESTLRHRAEAAEQETQRQLYTALYEQARTTVRSRELGQRVRALDALRRAAAISNTLELRRETWRALATPDMRFLKELPTGTHIAHSQLDPDFARIAVCLPDGLVEIRSVEDWRLLTVLPAETALTPCCTQWSPDGRYCAVQRRHGMSDRTAELEVWDLTTTQRTVHLPEVRGSGMMFHPSKPEMMVSEGEGAVTMLNVATGARIAQHGLPHPPGHFAYSPDGQSYAASFGLGRYSLSVRDTVSNVRRINIDLPAMPTTFAWHPSGRWIAVPVTDGRLLLADVHGGKNIALGRHRGAASRALFSPDGDYLFSLDTDGDWSCWAFAGAQVQFNVGGQSTFFQFSGDGRQCAVISVNSVKLYAFERPDCERELIGAIGECIRPGAFSPDGRWVVASGEGMIGIWDLTTKVTPALVASANNIVPFFSQDSSVLFLKSDTNLVLRSLSEDTNSPLEIAPFTLRGPVQSAGFYSNQLVITTTQSVEFVPLAATGVVRSVPVPKGRGDIAPDGRWFCFRPEFSPRVEIFQLPEMKPVCQITNGAMVIASAFRPQGEELAVLTRVGIAFFETTTWRKTRELPAEVGLLAAIRYAPDGRTFWLNRDLRNAALYDAQSLEEQLVLPMGMLPLAVDPRGRRLLLAVDGRRLQVWDLVAMRERFRALGLDWPGRR